MKRRLRGAIVVMVVACLFTAVLGAAAATGAVPRQASDGQRSLSVSQTTGLDPNGQTVQASGSGFDDWKGIYVAYCLVPPPGQAPTPCGGGQGGSGSAWIRSDQYGQDNGATPFGPGGSFSVPVYVTPMIGSIDCRRVQCAVVTRNDHKLTSDRGQDLVVPVSFAEAPAGGGGGSVGGGGSSGGGGSGGGNAAVVEAPQVDQAAIDAAIAAEKLTALPAPTLTLAKDGLSVSDGTRTLRVDRHTNLTANPQPIRVAGIGYDTTKPIDVALCAVPAAGAAPSTCLAGTSSTGASTGATSSAAWVASGPTSDGRTPTDVFGADGTFAVAIDVNPKIADGVDCRETKCAIVTRNDSSRPNDRSQDLVVPVSFVRAKAKANSLGAVASVSSDDSGSNLLVRGFALVAILALIAGVTTFVLRRRRRADGV